MADELSERTAKLFVMFKTAIEEERKAQALYREAVAMCDDPVIRAALESIGRDEARHEEDLIRRYNDLRATLRDVSQVEPLGR